MPMQTIEDQILLEEKLRRAKDLQAQIAQGQASAVPMPMPVSGNLDQSRQMANIAQRERGITAYEQPYLQANNLEGEAAPRNTAPDSVKQMLIQGFLGAVHPGGYAGYRAGVEGQERQRQQDVLGRVKDLRNEGFQQQQAYRQDQNAQLNREQQAQAFRLQLQEFESADAARRAQIEEIKRKASLPTEMSPGATLAPPGAGMTTPYTAPSIGPRPTDTEQDFASFLQRPELTRKYGTDRTAFRNYQKDQDIEKAKAGAQNRYDIGDPARNFTQERQLSQQLIQETALDQQRLASYGNLLSLGDDLSGADQIAVLYNFIRLMDPNRVSEGEMEIAKQAQSVPERWKAEAGRLLGTPNIFSPEGAKRLKATAVKQGTAIRNRVKATLKEYEDMAQRNGLDSKNIGRGIYPLLDSVDVGTSKVPPIEDGSTISLNPGEVLVKDAKGELFALPANQLSDAIKQGYTKVTK